MTASRRASSEGTSTNPPAACPPRNYGWPRYGLFFDVLVNRHIVILNPAATVRGGRYQAVEGKTPEITGEQARTLFKSIDASLPARRRDKAIIATLIYTAGRAGAVANLRLKDFPGTGRSTRCVSRRKAENLG
ncbi:MAG TPA: hypothetical protein VG055_32870 [Planctomycetaceae bacterium]|nr:hypothetical protein [Planctomycetaceae bacterium]